MELLLLFIRWVGGSQFISLISQMVICKTCQEVVISFYRSIRFPLSNTSSDLNNVISNPSI